MAILLPFVFIVLLSGCFGQDDTTVDAMDADKKMVDHGLKLLMEDAVEFAHNKGLIIRTNEQPLKSDIASFAAFTLYPSPFPRTLYQQAYDVQEAMALLYFRIARDYEWLSQTIREIAKSDYATMKMLEIMDIVHSEGIRQPASLVLQRSDYMCHTIKNEADQTQQFELKQVEVNNGPIGAMVVQNLLPLHRRVFGKAKLDPALLPENRPFRVAAEGVHLAWKKFGNPEAIVVVINGSKRNRFKFEQKQLEYEVEEVSGGKLKNFVYLDMNQAHESLRLAEDYSLMLGNKVVGLVYFRRGFLMKPEQLPDHHIAARLLIERSTAVKSPTMALELSCMKKIQQILALPGMVERFFPDKKDADKVAAIRATFANLWSLDENDDETKAVIEDAIAHPERYVLKPNREGGGHNYWNDEIPEKLRAFSDSDRKEHILMQRLQPFVVKNYPIRAGGDPKLEKVVTEFSTYGVLMGDLKDGKVSYNKIGGHLMRTKMEKVTEGGILEGSGFYDTPLLF